VMLKSRPDRRFVKRESPANTHAQPGISMRLISSEIGRQDMYM
jgi:hypothetical protein